MDGPRTDPVLPGIELRREERRYTVQGSTGEDLLQSLRRLGPKDESRSYFGFTEWTMSWEARPTPLEAGCALERVRVSVQLVTTLPEWTPAGTVADGLVARWERFVTALEDHESRHDELVLQGARVLLRRLRALRTTSCATLRLEAEATHHEVLTAVRTRNREYDDTTRHGVARGAYWPPNPPPRL